MAEFDKNQIAKLKGQKSAIARSCGVTQQYVSAILRGTRRQNSEKAQEIVRKAKAIIQILNT